MRGERTAQARMWRPRSFREGVDPDPRFTLANERTFLAWIRTALGVVAAAVGFEAFGAGLVSPGLHKIFVIALLIGAVLLSLGAFGRWFRVELAMRRGTALPVPTISILVVGLVAGAAATLFVVELTR